MICLDGDTPAELERAIQKILDTPTQVESRAEQRMCSLTGTDRTTWHHNRERIFMQNDVNRASLAVIESCMYPMFLKDYALSENGDVSWRCRVKCCRLATRTSSSS